MGSGNVLKLKEYIKIIRDTIDPDIELHLGAVPFNGIPLSADAYDSSKLTRDTGFKASVPFEEGIKLTVEWLKAERNKEKADYDSKI